jgi:glycosyltransferase involved in cell wall biosynthesis
MRKREGRKMMQNHSISIVIPFLNEEKSFPTFLAALTEMTTENDNNFEVIFVDNGSHDRSFKFVADYIKELKPKPSENRFLLLSETARGKGRAVRKGIQKSSGDYVVIIDADNEYDLRDFQKLLKTMIDENADLVLGSRHSDIPMRRIMHQPIMSFYFNTGHVLFTFYFNYLFKTKLTNPATMWKLMRGDVVRNFKLTGNSFNLDFELVAGFAKLKKVITEIPISYSARSKKEGKKIKLFIDPMIWLFSFWKYALRSPNQFVIKGSTVEGSLLK